MVSMQGRSIFIRLLRCKLHMISWQPDDCQPLSETRCDSSWIHHQAEACAMKEDFIAYRRGLVDSGGKAVKKQGLQTEF